MKGLFFLPACLLSAIVAEATATDPFHCDSMCILKDCNKMFDLMVEPVNEGAMTERVFHPVHRWHLPLLKLPPPSTATA